MKHPSSLLLLLLAFIAPADLDGFLWKKGGKSPSEAPTCDDGVVSTNGAPVESSSREGDNPASSGGAPICPSVASTSGMMNGMNTNMMNTRGMSPAGRPSLKKPAKKAWATVLTGDCYNNTMFVAIQILSLEKFQGEDPIDHVTLVLPQVSQTTRDYIAGLGSKVKEITPIMPPLDIEMPWWNHIFAKIHVWNLTDYDQVAYLDTDIFLNHPMGTGIFDLCPQDFCAIEANEEKNLAPDYPRPWFNGGLLVVRPSSKRFGYLTEERLHRGYSLPRFNEEGYLSEVFQEEDRPLGSFALIDWHYNTCVEDFYAMAYNCSRLPAAPAFPNPNFVDCLNENIDDKIRIIHHCADWRFNFEPLCSWEGVDTGLCELNVLHTFQDLLVEANPCAVGSQNEDSCMGSLDGQCQWCGDAFRCIPHDQECFNEARDSLTLIKRSRRTSEWKRLLPRGRRAWVTLLEDDNYNTTTLIRTQLLSVQDHSSYEHVTVVLDDVSHRTRDMLTKLGSTVLRRSEIRPFDVVAWRGYSKLLLWGLVDYDELVYMDPGAVVRNNQADEVFDACGAEFCAAEKFDASAGDVPGTLIQSGVMVLRPNMDRYNALVHNVQLGVKNPWLLEEGYLSEYLGEDSPFPFASFEKLDWRFNTCSKGFQDVLLSCGLSNGVAYFEIPTDEFAACWNRHAREVAIRHPCLADYPLYQDCTNGDAGVCKIDTFKEFQTLIARVNGCAHFSQNQQSCSLSGNLHGCHWCGEEARCISSDTDCPTENNQDILGPSLVQKGWRFDPNAQASSSASPVENVGAQVARMLKPVEPNLRKPATTKAWTTLLTGDCFNNTMFVGMQIHSVRKYSDYDHVTMVLPEVSETTRKYLSDLGSKVVQVQPFYPPQAIDKPWWNNVFSKLNAWNITDYEQVVCLDIDAYIANQDADAVFDACEEDFCAVEANEQKRLPGGHFPRPWINGGVLVLRPSTALFRELTEDRLSQETKYPMFKEETFLASAFLDSDRPLGSFKVLDWYYNSCSQPFFDLIASCRNEFGGETDYLQCLNRTIQAPIMHLCGNYRLNYETLCHWNVNSRPAFCDLGPMQYFQELLVQANPCALGGQSSTSCLSLSDQCQWCGESSRCVPDKMECFADTADTIALVDRHATIQAGLPQENTDGTWFTTQRILQGNNGNGFSQSFYRGLCRLLRRLFGRGVCDVNPGGLVGNSTLP